MSESNEKEQMPGIRYHDQTPVAKADNKRLRSAFSPTDDNDNNDELKNTIQEAVASAIPGIVKIIEEQIIQSIQSAIDERLNKAKDEIKKEVNESIYYAEERCNLKAKCESELLESYNRRENVRIIGLPEEVSDDPEKKNDEDYDRTSEKVVDFGSALESSITSDDISIAHRLPNFNGQRPRHVIVRFTRRVAKINLLKSKKNAANFDQLKHVRIFEDMTAPRLKFFNLMKEDRRIEKVWSREGTIHYIKNDAADNKVYKIHSLYDGGQKLGYDFYTVQRCFNSSESRVFTETSKESGS